MSDDLCAMSDDPAFLERYLHRIGYGGARSPSLATLRAIVLEHATAIPFENLDPFLGRAVTLEPETLERKLITQRRGGYCFEQNLLLKRALTALGFRATGLAARVLWMQPEDALTPRSHMLLRVELPEGTHIVDVGFGGMTLTGVLRLDSEAPQDTPHERFRLRVVGEYRMLQAEIGGEWRTLYRFDLLEAFDVDYDVSSYYLSTSPRSHFVSSLVAARAAPDRRFALRGNQLSVHHLGGPTERTDIVDAATLLRVLERDIGIELPPGPELGLALARILS